MSPTTGSTRAAGQAVVTLDGRDHYLGKHGTERSRRAYERLIAGWLQNGRHLPADHETPAPELLVAELCDRFLARCERELRAPDGTVSCAAKNVRIALRPLVDGELAATTT